MGLTSPSSCYHIGRRPRWTRSRRERERQGGGKGGDCIRIVRSLRSKAVRSSGWAPMHRQPARANEALSFSAEEEGETQFPAPLPTGNARSGGSSSGSRGLSG